MPFTFICSKCKNILHQTRDDILIYQSRRNLQSDCPSPPITQYIKHKIGDKCPKCGHTLSKIPLEVEVYPIKEKPWGEQKQ